MYIIYVLCTGVFTYTLVAIAKMIHQLNKKRIRYVIIMWLILTTLGATTPFLIQSIFKLEYEPLVISAIILLVFSVPNLILFLEFLIIVIVQKPQIVNSNKVLFKGQIILLNEIKYIEYVSPYEGSRQLPLFHFSFYYLHLRNGKVISVNNLTFDHKDPPLDIKNHRKVFFPLISLTSEKHPCEMDNNYNQIHKSVSFYKSKYSNKSNTELQSIIDNSHFFQKEAVEAAIELMKNSN